MGGVGHHKRFLEVFLCRNDGFGANNNVGKNQKFDRFRLDNPASRQCTHVNTAPLHKSAGALDEVAGCRQPVKVHRRFECRQFVLLWGIGNITSRVGEIFFCDFSIYRQGNR